MKQIVMVLLLGTLLLSSCRQDNWDSPVYDEQGTTKKEILWMTKAVDETPGTRAVGVKSKYWNPGDTIRIKFLNGTSALQQKVQQYAAEWLQYTYLHFVYVGAGEQADVKIGFDLDTAYIATSTLGTDCKAVPQDAPSLNFVWLDYEDEMGVQAEVLRGFGHVLGLGFEHKNPNSTLRFKGSDAAFSDEYNLSGQRLAEFKALYENNPENYDFTEYDRSSIMIVSIPKSLVVAPPMSASRNSALSENDKALVAKMYPDPVIILNITDGRAEIYVAPAFVTSPGSGDSSRWVDWGDGQRENLFLNNYYYHTYADNRERKITFYGTDTAYRVFGSFKGTKAIDVSRCQSLEILYCRNGSVASVDVSHNPELNVLSCAYSPLFQAVDVSHNPKLSMLDFWGSSLLSSIDVSHNPELTDLTCIGSPLLTSLDLSNNPELDDLIVSDCRLTSLNLSHCPKLEWVSCEGNGIASITLGNHPDLGYFDCCGNGMIETNLLILARQLPDRRGKSQGNFHVNDESQWKAVLGTCQSRNWGVGYKVKSVRAASAHMALFPMPAKWE